MNTRTALLLISLNLLAACNGSGDNTDVIGSNSTPPSIKGQLAGSTRSGEKHLFTPEVLDVDGDLLSFRSENKPEWAFIDVANGHMSGLPRMMVCGRYADIVIRAFDHHYDVVYVLRRRAADAVGSGKLRNRTCRDPDGAQLAAGSL